MSTYYARLFDRPTGGLLVVELDKSGRETGTVHYCGTRADVADSCLTGLIGRGLKECPPAMNPGLQADRPIEYTRTVAPSRVRRVIKG